MRSVLRALTLIGALALALPAVALEVGNTMPTLTLNDQFGHARTLTPSIEHLYYNRDRKGDQLLQAALGERGQALLDAQHAIVIADISDVPRFIAPLVLSRLKDRRYPVWLDRSGSTRTLLPYREDQVTVLDLDHGKLIAIRYLADSATLRQALAADGTAQAD